MKKLALSIFLTLPLAGCGSIAKEYVSADRATYEAIAPEYREYIDGDGNLTEDQKELRYANLDAWDYRIRKAEEADDE